MAYEQFANGGISSLAAAMTDTVGDHIDPTRKHVYSRSMSYRTINIHPKLETIIKA